MTNLQLWTLVITLTFLAVALGGLVAVFVFAWREIRPTIWRKE
jgi:hypothetical protein